MSSYLLDTNVVVRLVEPSAPEHAIIKRAVVTLAGRDETLVLAPQVLVEFWAIGTRPIDANGFGWSPENTAAAIVGLRQQFAVPDENAEVFDRWFALVQVARVRGKRAHDARIAAFMLVHGIPNILTLNGTDFEGFQGVVPVHPSRVAPTQGP